MKEDILTDGEHFSSELYKALKNTNGGTVTFRDKDGIENEVFIPEKPLLGKKSLKNKK